MILFLTYHKVSGGNGGEPDFYTVSRDQLAGDLQALAAAGYQPLNVASLLEQNDFPGRNYVLSFDDGTLDHYEVVFPLLRERDCRAVFFVPTSRLDRPGYMASAHLREMAGAGQTIAFHSHDHKRLDTMTDGEMRDQMRKSRDIIGGITGVSPWIFAPVGGFITPHVREVAQGFGVRAIRTMRWGYNNTVDLTALETIPLNRHTTRREFHEILEAHQSRSLYVGKQAMKALIPMRSYEQLRGLVFRLAGKH